MHVHKKTRVSATTEADVASLNLTHKCSACAREFTKQRGLSIHIARWCDGGRTHRSRLGTLTDKAVKTAKKRAAEATLGKVQIENNVLDNVYSFKYLGSRLQCDVDDEADVRYHMGIAHAAFASLSHQWMDHRLSSNMKLRLYNLCVWSTLTHSCEAWNLTKAVSRILNGFNSRCLHVINTIPHCNTKAKTHLPWISRELIRMQRRRNKSHKKAKQTGLNKHWEQFRELRRQTTKALPTSYKSYVNNQIGDSLKTNPKRFWSFIKANKRENIDIPTLRVIDRPITDDRDKATQLAK